MTEPPSKNILVEEIMAKEVKAVDTKVTVKDAASLMAKEGNGCISRCEVTWPSAS